MANEFPDIPRNMQKVQRRFRTVVECSHRPLADPAALMDGSDRTGTGARGFRHREGVASGVWEAEAVAGRDEFSAEEAGEKSAGVEGTPCRVYNTARIRGTVCARARQCS